MQQVPLRKTLFKYALLTGGVPLVLTLLLGLLLLLPRAQQDLHTHQQQLAAAVASQVESYLTTSYAIIISSAGLHQYDLGPHNIEHVRHVLESNVRTLKHLRAQYLVDRNGRIMTVAIAKGTAKQHQDLLGLDLSRNPLVAQVIGGQREQWSDTFLSVVGGGLSVALAVPSGNQVMVGEFELASLTDFLRQIDSQKRLQIFVLDRRGQVIADQAGTYTAQQLNLSNIPLVRQSLGSMMPLTGSFSFDGKTMVGSLQRVPGVDWSVLVAQPRSKAYGQLMATGGITAAGVLAALITGMIIALSLGRSLSRRFEALTSHAHSVSAGAQTAAWPRSSIAEFNTLAANLQQMSEALHERARLLEDEIAERQKAQESLHEKALLLEQEIAERVLAEQELQVKQAQLEALNLTLEQRVQEELAKNREKDAVMIQQGRLAAMGELISNIAHQWRQPLNELGIMIQMLRIDYDDQLLDEGRIDTFISDGMKTIHHLSQTINTFRGFFKANQPAVMFDASSAARDAIELVDATLQVAGIKVQLELQQGCMLFGQPNDFVQVLLNLCQNARDILLERSVSDPWIVIRTEIHANLVQVIVEDNAGGIAPDITNRIFEPYFTTRHKSQGAGLGLYISRKIIEELFRGTITAGNGQQGACIRIELPLATPQAEPGY